MKQQSKNSKLNRFRLGILGFLGVGLNVVGFQNCAPNFSVISEEGSVQMASVSSSSQSFEKVDLNLMSANQVLESLMAATQTPELSGEQRTEYNLRRGSFSDLGNPDSINAPYLFSLTSLSGPFCEGLVNRERALQDGDRRYFSGVNFTRNPRELSDERFLQIAEQFSTENWRRTLSEDERLALQEFKSSFLEGISNPASEQTRTLMISLCVAMLANVNLVVY